MKNLKSLLLLTALVSMVGCVNTVTRNDQGIMPAYQDWQEGRYPQPIEPVFEAAKRAINSFGNTTREGTDVSGANPVRLVDGWINQRAMYVRLEQVQPQETVARVQVRTRWGGTDLSTAREVVERIAVELQ